MIHEGNHIEAVSNHGQSLIGPAGAAIGAIPVLDVTVSGAGSLHSVNMNDGVRSVGVGLLVADLADDIAGIEVAMLGLNLALAAADITGGVAIRRVGMSSRSAVRQTALGAGHGSSAGSLAPHMLVLNHCLLQSGNQRRIVGVRALGSIVITDGIELNGGKATVLAGNPPVLKVGRVDADGLAIPKRQLHRGNCLTLDVAGSDESIAVKTDGQHIGALGNQLAVQVIILDGLSAVGPAQRIILIVGGQHREYRFRRRIRLQTDVDTGGILQRGSGSVQHRIISAVVISHEIQLTGVSAVEHTGGGVTGGRTNTVTGRNDRAVRHGVGTLVGRLVGLEGVNLDRRLDNRVIGNQLGNHRRVVIIRRYGVVTNVIEEQGGRSLAFARNIPMHGAVQIGGVIILNPPIRQQLCRQRLALDIAAGNKGVAVKADRHLRLMGRNQLTVEVVIHHNGGVSGAAPAIQLTIRIGGSIEGEGSLVRGIGLDTDIDTGGIAQLGGGGIHHQIVSAILAGRIEIQLTGSGAAQLTVDHIAAGPTGLIATLNGGADSGGVGLLLSGLIALELVNGIRLVARLNLVHDSGIIRGISSRIVTYIINGGNNTCTLPTRANG